MLVSNGPNGAIYSRFIRWSELGVFGRIFVGLVKGGTASDEINFAATHLKDARRLSITQEGSQNPCAIRQKSLKIRITKRYAESATRLVTGLAS